MGKFKIGDIVEITDRGLTYVHKCDFFKYFNFDNKSINHPFENGETGTIFGIRQHNFWTHETVLALQHEDGRQCLIVTDGVELKFDIIYRPPFKLKRKRKGK